MLQTALDSLNNAGPHGLSEILYAYASANANNGSAFAGLNGDTPWFNTTLGIVMLLGRFAYVIPVLALAGGARRQEEGAAVGRHLPDHRAAVRRPADRRHRHPLPAAIFPRARAGAGRRAFSDARRQGFLTASLHSDWSYPCPRRRKLRGCSIPQIIAPSGARRAAQARPAQAGAEPGDLRHRGRVAGRHRLLHSRLVTGEASPLFSGQIAFWLWFTVLFANFAEAVAEGRGKAQAETLRRSRSDTRAKRYLDPENLERRLRGRQRARSAGSATSCWSRRAK